MSFELRRLLQNLQAAFVSRRKQAKKRRRFNSLHGTSLVGMFQPLEPRLMLSGGPAVSTSRSIQAPAAGDAVAIMSNVTDTNSITSVNLTYTADNGPGTPSTVFNETFGSTAVTNWTGAAVDKAWTVTGATNAFRLNTSANYQSSTTAVGVVYNAVRSTTASITTANGINVTGSSATVSFWVKTVTLTPSDSWAFQIDSTGTGTSFATLQTETGQSHGYTQYTYNLRSSQLTSSNMKMRFAFTGGGTGDTGTIDVDQITVTTYVGGPTTTTVPMTLSGSNQYQATIPAQPTGGIVSYYVTATDSASLTTVDPVTAPASQYTYTVRAAHTAPTIGTTTHFPATVSSSSPVWITSSVADQSALTTVQLVYNSGSGKVTTTMFDDGAHQEGAAGDGLFGGQIPAMPTGTTVRYYVSATNDVGLTTTNPGSDAAGFLYSYKVSPANVNIPVVNAIPGGTFTMGDHYNVVDPNHPTDEAPLHNVTISSFDMGKFDVTNAQYCDYLNAALSLGVIKVVKGLVYGAGPIYGVGNDAYAETRGGQMELYLHPPWNTSNPPLAAPYSGISWNGSHFSVVAGNENMPITGVYWDGTVAYLNWLSQTQGYQPCYSYSYDTVTSTPNWTIDYTASGYRLPTEAEWEYAALGGDYNPYRQYAWGNDPNTDGAYANTLGSGSPYAQYSDVNVPGAIYPWTTPVGFYNGELHQKSDYGWLSSQTTYQTHNAENGYGLYDMSGNVWQWTNDWYLNAYYSQSPTSNPVGPTSGDYHTLRGGSYAHPVREARLTNRDPSVNREPLHSTVYAAVGFRVVLKTDSPIQPSAPVTAIATNLQSGQGVASHPTGNIYFADSTANKISELSIAGQLSDFKTNLTGLGGVKIDARGNVVAVESNPAQVVSISPLGVTTVLAAKFNDIPFNAPNSLWIDPQGGIYVTDPGTSPLQPASVYYISPDRAAVSRVNAGLAQPTGFTGSADGTTLYVSDAATGATYKYSIHAGVATNKTTFATIAATGMDIDTLGNIFMATSSGVKVYSPTGSLVMTVPIDATGATPLSKPATPRGLSLGGAEKRTLYITTASGLYSLALATQGVTINGAPTISGTARSIINPTATDVDWITSNVTDDGTVQSVNLHYTVGGTALPITEFTETMAATATAKKASWDGTGADNAWTVTQPTGTQSVTQQTTASIGGGNACGLQLSGGTANPADTMVTTVNGINTGGSAATIQFYLQCTSASSSGGWTLQINSGSGWTTIASETNNKHAWQVYNIAVPAAALSSNMLMRFQLAGDGTDNVNIDNITVSTTFGTTTDAPMFDDGLHHDGIAGDHVFGAQIPVQANGMQVVYSVIATDNTAQVSSDPTTTPYFYGYTVDHVPPTLQFNELMANATSFVQTTDFPTANLGLLTSSNVGPNAANDIAQGYTLVSAMSGSTSYLVDTAGKVIKSWVSSYTSTGPSVVLTPDGHLIRTSSLSGADNPVSGENVGGVIENFDWDGNLVGRFFYAGYNTLAGVSGLGYAQHHNMMVMPNGNILLSTVQEYTEAQALAAGFNPANLFGDTSHTVPIDGIVEVRPDWANNTYTTVWQWSYFNHLVQTYKTDANRSIPTVLAKRCM